jgi:ABC-2 type transport system permease protein
VNAATVVGRRSTPGRGGGFRRVGAILRKDLAFGPRSPVFLFAVAMPLLITLLLQVVFGALFERAPRLGIVAPDGSALAAAALDLDGVRASLVADEATLRALVTAHDLDGGLVLGPDFDARLRAGERPSLGFFVAGESLASDRILLALATVDLVRGVEGRALPVEVELVADGAAVPLQERLVPLTVLLALFAAGVFVTSFGFVEERERRTLDALLATPAAIGDVLWAKGLLGGGMAAAMAAVTLALNGGSLAASPALIAALAVGALMAALIGLVYGLVAPDTKALYALYKSLNLIVFAPALFYVFPDWPRWIAMLLPTYWLVDPIVRVAQEGAALGDVAGSLAVGVALCGVLAGGVAALARRSLGAAAA